MIVTRDGWVKRQKEVKDVAIDAAARRRRRARGVAGQHARHGRVLHESRRRVYEQDRRRARVDRLRRADPESVQVQGRRDSRRRTQPRRQSRRRHDVETRRDVRRRFMRSPRRATATAFGFRSSRSSSRARARAARFARLGEGAEIVGVSRIDGRRDFDCRHALRRAP